MKNLKHVTLTILGAIVVSAVSIGISTKRNIKESIGSGEEYSLVLSNNNPVSSSFATTKQGTQIRMKEANVYWNANSENFRITKGGYIQNIDPLHGIYEVAVTLSATSTQSSLGLYYSYAGGDGLNEVFYDSEHTFIAGNATIYTFNDSLPNYFRLVSKANTYIKSISVKYNCFNNSIDSNVEIMDDGLENSHVKDDGAVGQYGMSGFVTGNNNTVSGSKRAVRLTFGNSTNKYVSLDFNKELELGNLSKLPDFSKSTLTLKARFSANLTDHTIEINAISSSSESGYLQMEENSMEYDNSTGWRSFSLDFSEHNFAGNTAIKFLNIRVPGITNDNRSDAYLMLDSISYHVTPRMKHLRKETIDNGWENLPHDTGWENCYYEFNNSVTHGINSNTSIVVKPGKKEKHANYKWFTVFDTEIVSEHNPNFSGDLSNGLLSMYYKPVNVLNPGNIIFIIVKDWDNNTYETVSCSPSNDGWYYFEKNLSSYGFAEGSFIRFGFGFDVESTKVSSSRLYIDTMKHQTIAQDHYTQGWENLAQDVGWERCNAFVDRANTASDTSINSMRLTFNNLPTDKPIEAANGRCFILSPEEIGIQNKIKGNSGALEAKFMFSSNVEDFNLRLIFVDSSWKAARYDINTTPLEDGWRLLKIDLSNLPTPVLKDDSYNPNSTIRLGFGFHGVNNLTYNNAIVWIDDVFYNNNTTVNSGSANATVWNAFPTETVMKSDSTTNDREINASNPLYFDGLKNEVMNTQLMVRPTSNVNSYNLRMGTLYNSNGGRIRPESFEVKVEKYIYVSAASTERRFTSDGWRGAGDYPDALIPLGKIIQYNEDKINSNEQQGFWINLKANQYVQVGTYTGTAVLTLNGIDYNIPIEARIYNATMGNELHSKNYFSVWDDQIQIGEGDGLETTTTRRKYYDYLLDYRVNSHGISTYDRMDSYEEFAQHFAEDVAFNERVSVYRLPTNGSYDDIYGYFDALITKNIEIWNEGDHISFFDKIILYVNDEPDSPSEKSDSIPNAWNDVKDTQTNFKNAINALKGRLDNYSELKASFIDTRNVLPFNCDFERITGGSFKTGTFITKTKYYPNLLNNEYIDTPCPTFDHLNNESERDFYLSNFDHVWFYGCVVPTLPYPTYHIDTPLMNSRLIKWMQYKYNIEGELYWCVNYACRKDDSTNQESVVRDVWNDPFCWGMAAGDGMLVYPGSRYGIVGPISSIRLENIRNGNQDYEYFWMIDQKINVYNAKHNTHYSNARELLDQYFGLMFNGTKPTKGLSYATLNVVRQHMLTIIQEIYQ